LKEKSGTKKLPGPPVPARRDRKTAEGAKAATKKVPVGKKALEARAATKRITTPPSSLNRRPSGSARSPADL